MRIEPINHSPGTVVFVWIPCPTINVASNLRAFGEWSDECVSKSTARSHETSRKDISWQSCHQPRFGLTETEASFAVMQNCAALCLLLRFMPILPFLSLELLGRIAHFLRLKRNVSPTHVPISSQPARTLTSAAPHTRKSSADNALSDRCRLSEFVTSWQGCSSSIKSVTGHGGILCVAASSPLTSPA